MISARDLAGKQRDEPGHEIVRLIGFDHHGQFHGRSLHFDCSAGIGIHGAIHDVGPVNQFGHGRGIETEALLGDGGDKAGTGFEIRVVEFPVALILLEVGRIGGR